MTTAAWFRLGSRPASSVAAHAGKLAGWSQTAARISLGVVMFPHGAQKALGWYGGGGFSGTLQFFSETLGIAAPVTVAVIAIELLGAIALVLGIYTRFAALGVAAVMLGAIFTVHLPNGFFMNWSGSAGGSSTERACEGLSSSRRTSAGGTWVRT